MDVCNASPVFPVFVVFIMCHASTITMTTPPQVTVSSGTSSLLSVVTMAPSLMGLLATPGQHDVVLPPLLTPRHSGSVVGLATVLQQQPPSQMPLWAYANYVMGPPQVVECPTILYYICLVSVLVYAFCFQVPCCMSYSPMGAQPLGFASLQPFGAYPWEAYVQHGDGHQPTPGMHRVAASSTVFSRGSLMLLNQLFPSHPKYMAGHTALGAWQSHLISPPSLHCGKGLLFQVWFHLMAWLTMNLQCALNLVILVW